MEIKDKKPKNNKVKQTEAVSNASVHNYVFLQCKDTLRKPAVGADVGL